MEQLGLTPTRFWALVHRLIEQPDVEAEMPLEVHRLRRLRDARAGRAEAAGESMPHFCPTSGHLTVVPPP